LLVIFMKQYGTAALPHDDNDIVVNGGIDTTDPNKALPLEIDPLTGRLLVDIGSLSVTSAPPKPSDAYSIVAISETATYKYFFFEDKDANWYILRKTLATNVFDYAAGTGGYESVYDSPTTDPTGSPTFDTYGATF
jgi:hypothetical protein